MKVYAVVLAFVGLVTAAHAQDAVPDLKGTWSGKGKSIIFGNNQYNPGQQTVSDPPRVREIEVIYTVWPGRPAGLGARVIERRRYQGAVCVGDRIRQ